MQIIKNYSPPTTSDLTALKDELNYTGNQMADLAGVSGSNQWRKYTGGTAPRELGMHYLFYLSAQLVLSDEELTRITNKMRDIGASFENDEIN